MILEGNFALKSPIEELWGFLLKPETLTLKVISVSLGRFRGVPGLVENPGQTANTEFTGTR